MKKSHENDVHSICKTTKHYQIGRKNHEKNAKQLYKLQGKMALCCDQRKGMWKQVWWSQKMPQRRENSADDHETK